MIYSLGDHKPDLADDVYVADNASVIGNVSMGAGSSVWFNSVVRGDNDSITIGKNCNIQDGSVLHVDPGVPLTMADEVSIGHMVMLHGCNIEHGSLIGIGAVVLNNAQIGAQSLIGAKALITEGKVIPPRSLVMGSPGKVVRELTDEEIAGIANIVSSYANKARLYRDQLRAV